MQHHHHHQQQQPPQYHPAYMQMPVTWHPDMMPPASQSQQYASQATVETDRFSIPLRALIDPNSPAMRSADKASTSGQQQVAHSGGAAEINPGAIRS